MFSSGFFSPNFFVSGFWGGLEVEVIGGGWLPQAELRKLRKIRRDITAEQRQLKDERQRELKVELHEIFNQINGIEEVSEELQEIVQPFVTKRPTKQQRRIPVVSVDFKAMALQVKSLERMRFLMKKVEQKRQEDDELAILFLVN